MKYSMYRAGGLKRTGVECEFFPATLVELSTRASVWKGMAASRRGQREAVSATYACVVWVGV